MFHSKPILALLLPLAALAGCAGAPTQPTAAAAPAPVATAAAQAQHPELTGPIDPQKLVAMQHAGYRLVNRNGQTLYCEIDAKTGTRIARDPVCLTEEQMRELRERTQQAMDNMTRMQPPPQGK